MVEVDMECTECKGGHLYMGEIEFRHHGVFYGSYQAYVCDKCEKGWFTERSSLEIEEKAKELGHWGKV